MSNTFTLKHRINSIHNTRQITKAVEMVAASKLRRAVRQAQASRDYRQAAYALLAQLNNIREVEQQPLFARRKIKTRLYLAVTSNTGLAGGFNINIFKLLTEAINRDEAEHVKSVIITVGNKGAQFIRRLSKVELLAHYPSSGELPTQNEVLPILNSIIAQYINQTVDEVIVVYTMFHSSISQEATSLALLPAHFDPSDPAASQAVKVMNFEPDIETVIQQVAIRLIEAQIWQALLESLASKFAMRTLAMKNATDNAGELIDDYTLEYNTARQAAITQELAEITGGAEALKDWR